MSKFLLGGFGKRARPIAKGLHYLFGEELELVLERLIDWFQLTSIHSLDKGQGGKDTVKAVTHCLGQVKITFSFSFFNNTIDYVLSTA